MTRRQLTSLGALFSALIVGCSGSPPSGPSDLGSTTGAPTGGEGTGSSSGSFGAGTSGGAGSTGSTGASGSTGGSASGTSTGSGGAHADAGADASATGHTDAGKTVTGDSGGIVGADGGACPAPSGITSQQSTALQIINQTRAAMGSPCATIVSTLDTSATKHCQYYAANVSNMTCVANPHVEVSTCTTDYVAAQFYDRETAAGYMCQPSLTQMCGSFEVMAFDDNPTYALAQWIGSIYHRTPVLDPRTRDFGYGNATGCDTIDFGEGAGSTTASNVLVSYPYDGQTGVGTSFNGAQEEPTPPVPPNGWPSAMPITIFMAATSVTLTTDEFGVDGGAQLAHQVMTPQSNQLVQNALVLYGNAPLMSKTKYRVHVAGTRSTQSFSGSTSSAMFDVSFAFTTM